MLELFAHNVRATQARYVEVFGHGFDGPLCPRVSGVTCTLSFDLPWDGEYAYLLAFPANTGGNDLAAPQEIWVGLARGYRWVIHAETVYGVHHSIEVDFTCPADHDGDGGVTIEDLLVYLADFAAAQPQADRTGDSGVTIEDLIAFVAHFEEGC